MKLLPTVMFLFKFSYKFITKKFNYKSIFHVQIFTCTHKIASKFNQQNHDRNVMIDYICLKSNVGFRNGLANPIGSQA